jgi:hypothetical protein
MPILRSAFSSYKAAPNPYHEWCYEYHCARFVGSLSNHHGTEFGLLCKWACHSGRFEKAGSSVKKYDFYHVVRSWDCLLMFHVELAAYYSRSFQTLYISPEKYHKFSYRNRNCVCFCKQIALIARTKWIVQLLNILGVLFAACLHKLIADFYWIVHKLDGHWLHELLVRAEYFQNILVLSEITWNIVLCLGYSQCFVVGGAVTSTVSMV